MDNQGKGKMNENGLTYERWLNAAGTKAHPANQAAWFRGEDPTDWRASTHNPSSNPIRRMPRGDEN
jgi:hypothetical protein